MKPNWVRQCQHWSFLIHTDVLYSPVGFIAVVHFVNIFIYLFMLSPDKYWKYCQEQIFFVDSHSLEPLLGRCLCHSSELPTLIHLQCLALISSTPEQEFSLQGSSSCSQSAKPLFGVSKHLLTGSQHWQAQVGTTVWRAVEFRRVLRGCAQFCYTPPIQPLDGFTQKEVLQGQTQYLHEAEVWCPLVYNPVWCFLQ